MKQTAFLLIFAALPAIGQWRHFGTNEIQPAGFFGVGFSSPVNPVAKRLDEGWNVTGGVGVTNRWAGVMLDVMYNHFGLNRTGLQNAGAPNGNEKYWAVTIDPIVHVNQRGPVDFYITGGGGFYGQTTELDIPAVAFGGGSNVEISHTIYKAGVNGGAGFAFNAAYHGRVKMFVEARYHHMFTSGSGASFVPVTIGVRF